MTMERIERGSAWWLGRFVIIAAQEWHGPVISGQTGKNVRREVVFPVDQRCLAMHPKHPTGWHRETGQCAGSFSPSLSYYNDLCRYAGFRWSAS